jgi:hypothetical protein
MKPGFTILKKFDTMYYILFYKTVEDYIERRAAFRAEHLNLVNDYHARGELIMAGAFANPANGAVLIFKGPSPEAANKFALNDPYVKNGLIVSWEVREWTVVIGAE